MPAASSASTSLVLAESTEAAYRYASSDVPELSIVLAAGDGSVEVAPGPYDRIVVVGFVEAPAVLRTLIDRALDLVSVGGKVLVGGAAGPVDDDADRWAQAFDGLRIVSVDQGVFPAIEIAPAEGFAGDTGTFLRGALAVLGAADPRPVLTVTPEPGTAAPKPPATKRAPARPSRKQALGTFARAHRKQLLLAAVALLVALLISVGLVALIDTYFLGLVATATLLVVVAVALRLEQHHRSMARQLARVDAAQARISKALPAQLAADVRQQGKTLNRVQKSLVVNQLAIVDAAQALDRMKLDRMKKGLDG